MYSGVCKETKNEGKEFVMSVYHVQNEAQRKCKGAQHVKLTS